MHVQFVFEWHTRVGQQVADSFAEIALNKTNYINISVHYNGIIDLLNLPHP